jgi:TPR repeat protein
LQWFRRAAELGHAKSLNFVGSFYEDGWEVEIDANIALDYYRRAAQGGDFRGQFNCARLLAERGDIDGALHWLQRVPHSATAAFITKMQRWLAASPIGAFRALGENITANASSNPGVQLGATMHPTQESRA